MKKIRCLLCIVFLILLQPFTAHLDSQNAFAGEASSTGASADFASPLVSATSSSSSSMVEDGAVSLISTVSRLAEGDPAKLFVEVALNLPEGHYVYGPQESSMGLPTQVYASAVSPEDKDSLGEFILHVPPPILKRHSSFATQDDADELQIYSASPTFFVELSDKSADFNFDIHVSGLLCSADNCLPFDEKVGVNYGVQDALEHFSPSALQGFEASSLIIKETVAGQGDVAQGSSGEPLSSLFIPMNTATPAAPAYDFITPEYFQPGLEVNSLGSAIILGLIAGLLLNLMPCVLPVLSLKFSALMAVSNMPDKRQQARAFKAHCLVFALGIMTWFAILSVLFGLAGMAWGQLFQEPLVVSILALILFLLGLSLFGVFTLPMLDLKSSSSANPHWQAFTSGMLATLLATPCSGPLLGGVLSWALQQPLKELVATILSVGLGMALPYCVMAFKPRLVYLLPKPGPWTLRLEQLLGFFLMGSVVYLFSQLPENWVLPFMTGLMSIAFAAWLWGQVGHLGARPWVRNTARLTAVCTIFLAVFLGKLSLTENPHWENFEPESFNTLLGKENVLVQFTADWCPSCKALEHTTLREKRMSRLRSKYDMRTIRVDLTRENVAGEALLEAVGSKSIPVLVLFPKGDESSSPLVVRDLVTPNQLKDALKQRF